MPQERDTHAPLADGTPLAEAAVDAFLAALAAAQPDALVKQAVRQGVLDDWLVDRERPRMIQVLAIGKAAPRMLWGLVEGGVPFRGVGVAPKGVPAPGIDTFQWHVGDHPLPGDASFAAGRAVEAWCDALPNDAPVLVLLSGGASACIETPADGRSESEVRQTHAALLAAGLPIEELNRRRAGLSGIKGGRLGKRLLARTGNVRVWLLADTDPATAAATVGAAPFWQTDAPERIPHRVLASVEQPIVGAGLRLGAQGWSVYRHATRIHGPLPDAMASFMAALAGLPGDADVALVGGGEADLAVPAGSPPGGRAQHAALLAAQHLTKTPAAARVPGPALVLCAATDGVDGSTDAAGAWATAGDWSASPDEAGQALEALGAHAYLRGRKRLLHTGPTGTNLNDVWIALRKAG